MGTITLIRHGQASFGKANYDQLSELGFRQGRELGQWFSQCQTRLDRIVTGALARHKQTAQACCETLAPELRPDMDWETLSDFNEYDHVQMLHRQEPGFADPNWVKALFADHPDPRKEFQRIFSAAFARWIGGQHDDDYDEPWAEFRERCIRGLNTLMDSAARSQHIAVFTSGGPISAITQHLLKMPDSEAARLNSSIVNASTTKILFQPGHVTLSALNNHAHFERLHGESLITYR